jgi:hypothetical protein
MLDEHRANAGGGDAPGADPGVPNKPQHPLLSPPLAVRTRTVTAP